MKRVLVLLCAGLLVFWAGVALAVDEVIVESLQTEVSETKAQTENNSTQVKNLKDAVETNTAAIMNNVSAIAQEHQHHIDGDDMLEADLQSFFRLEITTAISEEETARMGADDSLQAAINSEANIRETADAALQTLLSNHSHDAGDLPAETDPVWTAEKSNYATLTDVEYLQVQVEQLDANVSTQKQNRVFGYCEDGSSIRTIAEDGTVTCETDTDTTYLAGFGLELVGSEFIVNSTQFQKRIIGICPEGSSIRTIAEDGTVTCEDNTDTKYQAGFMIDLIGDTFQIDFWELLNHPTMHLYYDQSQEVILEERARQEADSAEGEARQTADNVLQSQIDLLSPIDLTELEGRVTTNENNIATNAVDISTLQDSHSTTRTGYLSLGPANFKPSPWDGRELNTAVYRNSGSGLYVISTSPDYYYLFRAPVNLPHNAKVTSVTMYYRDTSALYDIGFNWFRWDGYGYGEPMIPFVLNSSGDSGPGSITSSIMTIDGRDIIDNANWSYEVLVGLYRGDTNLSIKLFRILIEYEYTLD